MDTERTDEPTREPEQELQPDEASSAGDPSFIEGRDGAGDVNAFWAEGRDGADESAEVALPRGDDRPIIINPGGGDDGNA